MVFCFFLLGWRNIHDHPVFIYLLGLFGVNPDSGAMFTRRDLMSTPDIMYTLTVQAEDGGYPVQVSRASVSIAVESPHGYDGKPRFRFPQDSAIVNLPEVCRFVIIHKILGHFSTSVSIKWYQRAN